MVQSNSYFTISNLAKELDVKKSHIRFCEENGLIAPRASKLKRRVYNRYDRERLKLVFHFVLLGYSKEQIVELIGIPDANLDEDDQLMQGVEHGLRELKKLEKRKEELNFTKQTRIINEIEMLREYISKIKIIKSGEFEEPLEKPSIRFEDKTKISVKPVASIMTAAGKNTTQHPIKVISLFVIGFVLVSLIGGYFYHQAGQKETRTIKPAQKKPIHSEKFHVPQEPVPENQIAKTQSPFHKTQKLTQSSVDSQQSSLKEKSTILPTDSTKTLETGPVTGRDSLISEKEKLDTYEAGEILKNDVQEEVAGEDFYKREAFGAVGEDTLTATVSESVKERATDVEVREVPEPESAAKASPVTDDVSLTPKKGKFDITTASEAPEVDIQKEVNTEELKEKAVSNADGEDTLTAAVPESGVEKMVETEVKPTLVESEKEMDKITSEEGIHKKKKELSRLKSFLDEYCKAYTNKDFDKFITFFTLDATENSKPFHKLLPDYRKNMEGRESLAYRIELMSYSKQNASENLVIRGRFFTRYQSQNGVWKEKNGTIVMELLENGDSFLVRQLNY